MTKIDTKPHTRMFVFTSGNSMTCEDIVALNYDEEVTVVISENQSRTVVYREKLDYYVIYRSPDNDEA